MKIPAFDMEQWLMRYRFSVTHNLAESGIRDISVGRLLDYAGRSMNELADIVLQDEDTRGTRDLRELIARSYENVSPDNILVTTGTSEALFAFFNTFLLPGNSVIAERPGFQALWQVPQSIPCRINYLELSAQDRFEIDMERLEALVDNDTRLIIINTPHNPSGRIRSEKAIRQIHEIAVRSNAYLLVDEHYRYLPLDSPSPLRSTIDYCRDNIVVTGSITKCFGLIGLRIGWIIGPEDIIDRCRDYRDYLTHVLSPVTDRLARFALEAKEKILRDNIEMVKHNRLILENFINEFGDIFGWTKPEGGAVAFPVLKTGENAEKFVKECIRRKGVFFLPGSTFNRPGHFRVCLGVPGNVFNSAMEGVKEAMAEVFPV